MTSLGIRSGDFTVTNINRRNIVRAAASTFLGVLLGGIVALVSPRVYRADVKMLPADQSGLASQPNSALAQLGGLATLAGVSINDGGSRKAAALEILRSQSLARAFIRERALAPTLVPNASELSEYRQIEEAVRIFDRGVRHVSEDRRTGIITLSIEWSEPNTAAQWANELVRELNEQMRQRARETSEQSLTYLNQQLQKTNVVEVRQVIFGLVERQLTAAMLAEVHEEFSLAVIDPAAPPDSRNYVRPSAALWCAGGGATGLLLSIVVAAGLSVGRANRDPVGSVGGPTHA